MKNTRKILSVLLAVVMMLSILPIAAIDSFAVTSEDGLWEFIAYNPNPLVKKAEITNYKGTDTNLVIPAEIDGYTVTALLNNIVNPSVRYKITSVVIPDSVTYIDSAFANCIKLSDIQIPDTLTYISCGAFENTAFSNDEQNWTDGMLIVGKYLLCVKDGITDFAVPGGVIGLSYGAFADSDVQSVTLPDSLKFISENAFRDCSELKSVTLPQGLETIGEYAFMSCSSLESITIPSSVEVVPEYCFRYCTELKNIVISDGVKVIEVGAFLDCPNIEYIYIGSAVNQIDQAFPELSRAPYVEMYWNDNNLSGLDPAILHFGDNCTDLLNFADPYNNLEKVYIGKTVRSIPAAFLNNCNKLEWFEVDAENPYYSSINGVIYNKNGTELVRYPQGKSEEIFIIPDGVKKLRNGAVSNAPSVKILVPPSVGVFEDGWIDGNYGGALAGQRTIYGYTGTAAEAFAKSRDYIFIPLNPFADVPYNAWFLEAVKYSKEKGFITGYKNGNFGPADRLQRQDFIVILARIAGVDLDSYDACALSDVDINAYYGKSVAWAVANDIIKGYENGKFGVGDAITREQVAVILYSFTGRPDKGSESAIAGFADKDRISSFAKDAMIWAVNNGVITGRNSTTLAPTDTASRAEIATMIARMDQKGMFD